MPSQQQIRDSITKPIIEALESGGLPPWKKPWRNDPNCGPAANIIGERRYRGINPLLLQIAALRHGFVSKWWATYRQWERLGARVKRRPENVPPGQWGTTIVLWKPITKKLKGNGEDEKEDTYFLLRTYHVFNLDQVEGEHLDRFRAGRGEGQVSQIDGYLEAKRVVEATGADIRHGGNDAYYKPSDDYIRLPYQSQMGLSDYFETAFHELCHWSEPRLGWKGSYAEGELRAEIGSCFIADEVGIPSSGRLDNHAAYLASWLRLGHDERKVSVPFVR